MHSVQCIKLKYYYRFWFIVIFGSMEQRARKTDRISSWAKVSAHEDKLHDTQQQTHSHTKSVVNINKMQKLSLAKCERDKWNGFVARLFFSFASRSL